MSQYRVTLRNRGNASVMVDADGPILDALEAAGFVVPYGCRYGGCITCAARKLAGSVRQPNGTALNKRQSGLGYVLLCVARPRQDCVFDVGVESHDELYVNPFAAASARDALDRIARK